MNQGDVVVSKNEQWAFQILEDFRFGKITREKAAMLLGCSTRSVTRRAAKVRSAGIAGIKHGNTSRPPANKTEDSLKEEILTLIRERYYDFNVSHCRELLSERHGITVSYSVLWQWCDEAGLKKHKKRIRAKARVHRERMSNEGLLLQMDGSHHEWNGSEKWCLIAMIDDATSDIPYAEFFPTEDTMNCMRILERVIEKRGIPEAIYVDRAGWFGGIKRQEFSQFDRACQELGIRIIYANSPQAKGRIERAWRTFQDRLIPELRLEGIKAMAEANSYLQEAFLEKYWVKRNTVTPLHPENRYRNLPSHMELSEILCLKAIRKVRSDHTILWGSEQWRLLTHSLSSLKGRDVEIRIYRNAEWGAYFGNRRLKLEKVRKRRQGVRRTEELHQPDPTVGELKRAGNE